MWVLETIAVAFSMFSAIPMPVFPWNGKNMRYMLCAFPLVGAMVGVVCFAAGKAAFLLGLPELLRGAVLCVLPPLLTGGIHLDGYADTVDALSSHAGRERMLEILKDPHVGSFAVIRLCMYFVLTLALYTAVPEERLFLLLPAFCLSRTLSGLAVTTFPMAKETGLARSFANAADRSCVRIVMILWDVILCLLLCLRSGLQGILMAGIAHLVFGYYYCGSRRWFGGITGDLAGWFLCKCELWMILGLVVSAYFRK